MRFRFHNKTHYREPFAKVNAVNRRANVRYAPNKVGFFAGIGIMIGILIAEAVHLIKKNL